MSLDDYIDRKDQIPPVYNPEENRSSLEESYLPLVQGLPGIAVAQRRDRPFNTTINRFDPEYWLVDYNALMVATILPVGARSFKVPVQWRTNRDFLGVRWVSKDTLSHQNFTYQEQKDYSNLVLGFRHNPDDPGKFTVTITNSAGVFTYRLAPYVWNNTSKKYECLDKKLGTNKTYPASVYVAGDTTIADADMVEYKGRKDYIFILDFNDLRSGHNFSGQLIDPRKVDMISFDCTEEHHGLGKLAYLAQARSNGDGTSTLELGGVHSTAQLSEGDKLQALWTYYDNAGQVVSRENVWEVISYEGFGTSALTVKVKGSLPGWFIESPAFYGRYLKADCPIAVKDTVKLFSNLTLTGNGRKMVGKRRYTQQPNGMGMTSGFDDGYNLSPQRQVKQVVDLGYRNWWTTYIGMSHYFNARTAYQKKSDGSLVLNTQVLDWPVLYAGETQLNGQYYIGRTPGRGIDALQTGATGPWDTNYGGIMAFNGTTLNSAADKAAALVRGSYWWDLEANEPGPALLDAVDAMQGRIPHGIVWCQGDQDAQTIGFPGNRNPVPTVARTRLATLKVFEYFRNLWGPTLPIFIQEQAWGWSITDPSQPEVPVGPGTPTNLRARRTTWGDLVLEWQSYKIDPLFLQYKVEIYHPNIADRVIHTETVQGKVDGNYAYFDWPVEKYIPVQLANGLGQSIPTSIKFRVTAVIAGGNLVSKPFADFVPIDNTMVKQLIAVGVNQYTGGWFTSASDPGGTGAKNRIAASAMRVKFANLRAMRLHQVMPLDISWGPGLIVTDWWNNGPGPALLEMTQRINDLGLRVNFVTQGNPYETEQLKDLDAGQRATKIATWRQATIDMLAWMRSHWDNPLLEMYIQGATSIWEGRTNPVNINAVGTAEMKKAQSRLCLDVPGFLLGSYVPGGEDFTNYVYTGVLKKFYNQQTYHAAAVEMGESMALHINRAVDDTPEYLNPCVGMNRSFELPYFMLVGAQVVVGSYTVTPFTQQDGNGGWASRYVSANAGGYAPAGSIFPTNAPEGLILISNGISFPGSELSAQTSIGVWGQESDHYDQVRITYAGHSYVFPLTYTSIPGGPAPGAWMYNSLSAEIDMSTGGVYSMELINAGALVSLGKNDGYLGQVTEKGNRPDNFGVRTYVKPSAPTPDEIPADGAGFCSTVPPDWEGGDGTHECTCKAIIMRGTINLRPDGEDGGYYTSLVEVIAPQDAIYNGTSQYPVQAPVWYYPGESQWTDNSFGFSFGPKDHPWLSDVMDFRVYDETDGGALIYQGTLYRAGGLDPLEVKVYYERPIANAAGVPPFPEYPVVANHPMPYVFTNRTGHTIRYEVGALNTVCCGGGPIEPEDEGTVHYRISALWEAGNMAWIDGQIVTSTGTNGPWSTTPPQRVAAAGADFAVPFEVALLDQDGNPMPENKQVTYGGTQDAPGGVVYTLKNAQAGHTTGVPGGTTWMWGGATLVANRTVKLTRAGQEIASVEFHVPQVEFTQTTQSVTPWTSPMMDSWDSGAGSGSVVFDRNGNKISGAIHWTATGSNKRPGPNYFFTIYAKVIIKITLTWQFKPSGVTWIDDAAVFTVRNDGGGTIGYESTVYCDWNSAGVPSPGPDAQLFVTADSGGPNNYSRVICFNGQTTGGSLCYMGDMTTLPDYTCTPIGLPVN